VCLEMLRDLVARGRDWRVVQELLRHAQAQVCTRVNRDLI
jgi:site-specific recombinase XerD